MSAVVFGFRIRMITAAKRCALGGRGGGAGRRGAEEDAGNVSGWGVSTRSIRGGRGAWGWEGQKGWCEAGSSEGGDANGRARVIGEGRRCGQGRGFLTAGLYSAFRARMAILRRSNPVLRFVVATRFLGGEEGRGGEDTYTYIGQRVSV